MQFPKLTPLQSRFAASLTASCALVIVYLFFFSPRFAYAAEIGSASREDVTHSTEDHNWARIAEYAEELVGDWMGDSSGDEEVEGGNLNHSGMELRKRDTVTTTTLAGSNYPGQLNINAGETQVWIFSNTSLWGNYTSAGTGLPSDNYLFEDGSDNEVYFRKLKARGLENHGRLVKRQDTRSREVFISVNTCLQPTWNSTAVKQTTSPPQLTLYVSNDTSNVSPGPNVTNGTQVSIDLSGGFANYTFNATTDVYMALSAPDLPTNFTGVWNYEIAASIDNYYHYSWATTFLYLVDTDTADALLVTDNLTQANPGDKVYEEWMNLTTPFIVFAQNTEDLSIAGVHNSYCGLKTTPAQIVANPADPDGTSDPVQMNMITRGLGNKPKEQFYIKELNASSDYQVFLAMQGNSTAYGAGVVGGGGQVWAPTSLTTKSGMVHPCLFPNSYLSSLAFPSSYMNLKKIPYTTRKH